MRTTKELIKELDISVACLLDDLGEIEEKDIFHLQDLIAKLEYNLWGKENGVDKTND
jgi:hypothetical protein|tara:strand:- start:283 stop:453 length:171 start_codon:yes stop_codon:yes gene_type:complete